METPKETPATPKTGDSNHPAAFILLLIAGLSMLDSAVWIGRKRKKEAEEAE